MIDEFTEYLLDQIEIFKKDAKEEPGCEYAAGALLQALVKYQNSIAVQAKRC